MSGGGEYSKERIVWSKAGKYGVSFLYTWYYSVEHAFVGEAKTRFVWGIALDRPVSIDAFPYWFKGFD